MQQPLLHMLEYSAFGAVYFADPQMPDFPCSCASRQHRIPAVLILGIVFRCLHKTQKECVNLTHSNNVHIETKIHMEFEYITAIQQRRMHRKPLQVWKNYSNKGILFPFASAQCKSVLPSQG